MDVYERIDDARAAVARMRIEQPAGVARPPGPPALRSFLEVTTGRPPIQQFFQRMQRTYQPIGHVQLGRDHVYCLADPDVIWRAFVTDGRFTAKGRALQLTRPLLGNGLLTSEDPEHMQHRRLVQPAFHRSRIEAYADEMVAVATEVSQRWTRGVIDVPDEMSALTLDVVGRTLFGQDLSGAASQVSAALTAVLEGFTRVSGPLLPSLTRLPTRGRRRMLAAIAVLDDVVLDLIRDYRSHGTQDGTVLSLLLQVRDEESGRALTDDEVRDEVMTLVLAGHETTAMALSWAIRDLSTHPKQAEWMREELDRLPERLSFADLSRLPRTHAVVAEAMRLHPPAWIIGRYATQDLELAGWHVPAGSVVVASQYALHRDPRWWEYPTAFHPMRWLAQGRFDERAPGQPRAAWFPFGFGSRRCIGEQFAWVEAVLVLATLLREWDIRVVDPDRVVPFAAVTLRPKDGMAAVVMHRSGG